mgnify:CR=1 FL=1
MLRFKNLYPCDFEKVFNWVFTQEEIRHPALMVKERLSFAVRRVLSLLLHLLFKCSTMKTKSISANSTVLFLFLSDGRGDTQKMFRDVANTIDHRHYDLVIWEKCRSFSLKRSLDMARLCVSWWNVLRQQQEYGVIIKLLIIKLLVDIKDKQDGLMETYKDMAKFKLTVFFYDAIPFDNYFSQVFQVLGSATATLQHGVMLAPRLGLEDNIDFVGGEFKNSVSDYFLAWNEFTRREAVKAGIPMDKIKVLGIAKCLGLPPFKPTLRKTFGIILDGFYEKENNSVMIEIACSFAKQAGYHFIVRYHPDFRGDEYTDIIPNELGEECSKAVSLDEFANNVSFCIISNSTVMFEFLYRGMDVFHYSSSDDKFKDLPLKSFRSLSELVGQFNIVENCKERELEDLVCQPRDIASAYRNFFSNYCGN